MNRLIFYSNKRSQPTGLRTRGNTKANHMFRDTWWYKSLPRRGMKAEQLAHRFEDTW
jgi:hypothetical protein